MSIPTDETNEPEQQEQPPHIFELYIADDGTPLTFSINALEEVLFREFGPRVTLEVIDIVAEPDRARSAQILAIPTLIHSAPPPVKKFVGAFSGERWDREVKRLQELLAIQEYAQKKIQRAISMRASATEMTAEASEYAENGTIAGLEMKRDRKAREE
jgi:hypothetical protein